jgi:NADPH-dependent 2,4-dienoyl-CoA reductase/sulfur reductase-like enzyme
VTLVERTDRLGGQFRLAGLQPSRGQITDLLAWYGRELERLGVDLRLGADVDATGVAGYGADEIVLATGSRPPVTGFQRAMPLQDRLPGVDGPGVASIQAILDGSAQAGARVVVLDDLGDWRGIGTALHLAERGHDVTLVTSAPVVAGGLFHSAADGPLRERFARAGGRSITGSVVVSWRPGAAVVRTTLSGETRDLPADTLVIAETAEPVTDLADALTVAGVPFHAVGDCVAARRGSLAIYEGRSLGLRL